MIGLTAKSKLEGLFNTFGMRPKVNTTSSAVNGVPSVKVTPSRSLNSHTVGLIDLPGDRQISLGMLRGIEPQQAAEHVGGQHVVWPEVEIVRVHRGEGAADGDVQRMLRRCAKR